MITRFLKSLSANQTLLILLSFWTILNVFQATYTELSDNEAYYWVLSQQFEWGYFAHPPLFTWLVGISTAVLGDSEVAVRLLIVVLQPIYLYLFWATIRPLKATKKLAVLYFVVCFALPLLQLYGVLVTPSATLLLTMAMALYSYRKFLRSGSVSLMWAVAFGASAGLMAYANYYGALVIALILLSNVKLIVNYRVYVAGAVAVVVMLPHIIWLSGHEWTAFVYYVQAKTAGFDASNFWLYLFNTVIIFNPLLFPIFIVLLLKKRRMTMKLDEKQFFNAMRFIAWGFMFFFVFMSRKMHVEVRWLLPIVFPMVYFLIRGAATRPAMYGYLGKISLLTLVVVIGLRVFIMVYEGDLFGSQLFNNKTYATLNMNLKGKPLITDGNHLLASKMRYYGGNEAFSQSSIFGSNSQYYYMQNDANSLFGRDVAIALSSETQMEMNPQQLNSEYQKASVGGVEFYYDTINNFKPTARVRVMSDLPRSIMSGQSMTLDITMENPYKYSFNLVGEDKYSLYLQLRVDGVMSYELYVPIRTKVLPAMGRLYESVALTIPTNVPTNDYLASFTLIRYPFGGWYNGKRVELRVVKP